jgi:2-methylcitrate dehydratase PrpD
MVQLAAAAAATYIFTCSPHVWTGLIGLALLSFQAMLPLFFAESSDSRSAVSACQASSGGVETQQASMMAQQQQQEWFKACFFAEA